MVNKKDIAVKIISLVVFCLLCMLVYNTAKAEEKFIAGDYVSRIYLKKEKGNRKMYLRSQWIRRASDNQFVYCLEPWVIIDENSTYQRLGGNDYEYLNLSKETLDRVKLISYYGYGYTGHEQDYWYTITQMLIWKTVDPDGDFYYTDVLNGNRINMYENEMSEINRLVDAHYTIPSFSPRLFKTSIDQDFEIIDENNVLDLYEIKRDPNNIVKSKEGNRLVVHSDIEMQTSVDLVKKANLFNSIPLVYFSQNSQSVMSAGNFYDLNTNVNFKFISGSINLQKLDKDNKSSEYVSLNKAKYELLDENNNVIKSLITDEEGKASLTGLPLGKYHIKESEPSMGYQLDQTVYDLDLTIDNPNKDLTVYEEKELKEIEINKKYFNIEDYELYPEENTIFEVYTKNKNELVGKIITDKNGNGSIKLPYGEYIIKQATVKDGYKKVNDFEIIIDEQSYRLTKKELVNYPILYKVDIPNTSKSEINLLWLLLLLLISKTITQRYENNK